MFGGQQLPQDSIGISDRIGERIGHHGTAQQRIISVYDGFGRQFVGIENLFLHATNTTRHLADWARHRPVHIHVTEQFEKGIVPAYCSRRRGCKC